MMTAWIIYGLVVGCLLAATARCLEGMCRLVARPGRWVWVGALGLLVVLVAGAPRRAALLLEPPSTARGIATTGADSRGPAETGSWSMLLESLHAVRRMTTPAQNALLGAVKRVPVSLNRYLAAFWLSLSTLLLVLFSVVYARFRRARRHRPAAELHGVRVRVTPTAGPAVIGLYRPEIVIPQWLFLRSAEEQRLVLTHEREHVRTAGLEQCAAHQREPGGDCRRSAT